MSRNMLWLLGSTRHSGNTEALAMAAAATLPTDVRQTWLRLAELPLPEFVDRRHVGDGRYPSPTGNERTLFDATVAATDIVVATPLYWYTVSTPTKRYLDYWSAWLRVPDLDFRACMSAKTLWGVTVTSHEDMSRTEPVSGTLRLCAEYLGMGWGGTLIGYGNRPGELDAASLQRAATHFSGVVALGQA